MSDKKIYVPIDELLTSAGGLHTYITCPDCGDSVHVAENLLLETSCRCREKVCNFDMLCYFARIAVRVSDLMRQGCRPGVLL